MCGHAQPWVTCVCLSLSNRLLSPQPASLALSPRITQSGCHPGISAMFHVLACACTRTLPFCMYSQALTAPTSACMCWSFGDPWYLCYLADCIWQRLVGYTTKLQRACQCVGLCVFWGWQTKWSHGEALASWLKTWPYAIRPCLLLIGCSPYTILGSEIMWPLISTHL